MIEKHEKTELFISLSFPALMQNNKITDVTQEAEKLIKSICYERFCYQTTACDAILPDWFDLPQFSDELCLFGISVTGGVRPTVSGFVSFISIFKMVMRMDGSQPGVAGWLLNN